MSDIDFDIDNKIHLFAIHEDSLDVFSYPFMSTLSDLKDFISGMMECDSNVPVFFKYPVGYSLYDCGTYEPVLSDGSNSPYNCYSRPRLVGRLIDFKRGDKDGKGECTNKNL